MVNHNDTATNSTVYKQISISDVTQMTFEVILMMFICTVNTLTLVTVLRNKILWTVPNMYVISLAVADLLTGLSLAYQMVFHIPEIKSEFDKYKYLCLFRHVIFFITHVSSVTNMVLIAFDRWTCITFPLTYQRLATIPKAGMLIAIAWIIGTFIGAMPLYMNNWDRDVRCRFFKVLTMEYQVYFLGGYLILCAIIIAACYGHIFRIANTQRKIIRRISIISNAVGSDTRMSRFKRDWELVVMFGVVFGIFFICSAPAFIYVIISHTSGVPEGINSFTIPLLMMNSGMNFVIYVVKNSQFRASLKAMCFKRRTSSVSSM